MKFNKGLNQSLDGSRLKRENEDNAKEMQEKTELGKQFVEAKEKLETLLNKLERSNLSNAEKGARIADVKAKLNDLATEYERRVVIEVERLQAEHDEIITELEALVLEMERIEDSIREADSGINSSVNTGTNLASSADQQAQRRAEINREKDMILQDQKIRMEQMNMLDREMQRNMGRRGNRNGGR